MILPISNLATKNSIHKLSLQNIRLDYSCQDNNKTQKSKILFTGSVVNWGEPVRPHSTVDEAAAIQDARKYMNEASSSWKSKLRKSKIEEFHETVLGHNKMTREIGKILSFGLLSLGARESANEHVQRVCDLIPSLLEEERQQKFRANEDRRAELEAARDRLNKMAAEAEEKNRLALAKTEYLNKLNEKKNKLNIELCDKINLEKNGSHIEKMPNTIMIEDPYDDVSKELVDYARRNTQSRFIRLDSSDNDILMDNLEDTLKKSKMHFDSTQERTLIHVDEFDRLITKGKNSFENIDSLKDIMCRSAKDFGSTIIFRTTDAKKLVSEAIQPQRVVQILINFKSIK